MKIRCECGNSAVWLSTTDDGSIYCRKCIHSIAECIFMFDTVYEEDLEDRQIPHHEHDYYDWRLK